MRAFRERWRTYVGTALNIRRTLHKSIRWCAAALLLELMMMMLLLRDREAREDLQRPVVGRIARSAAERNCVRERRRRQGSLGEKWPKEEVRIERLVALVTLIACDGRVRGDPLERVDRCGARDSPRDEGTETEARRRGLSSSSTEMAQRVVAKPR